MKLNIKKIKVKNRIRKDNGNIKILMQSLDENGLINPVVVNQKNELLSGYRRLLAAKKLGWNEIEVKVVETTDELDKINIELEENIARKDFTPDELQQGLNKRSELLKLKNMSPFKRFFYIIFKKILDFINKIFKFEL